MGDKHHCLSLFGEFPDYNAQLLGLLGGQNSRGLIKDQDLRTAVERL